MLTNILQQLLSLDLRSFPLMAAASASIKGCKSCPHNKANPHTILKAAAMRYLYNEQFKQFLKQHFRLPLTIAGVTFK